MKIKVNGVRVIYITGEYIKLDALLKFASIASTGGEAKHRIKSGEVFVGKDICTSRGKKIKPGDVVRVGESVMLVKQEV
jgi:ribosome-associated protein